METDPDKYPGVVNHPKRPLDNLIITPPEAGLYLRDIIARIEQAESDA